MPDHQLKISADTKKLEKSLTDLSKFAKRELGSSNIQLFSKETNKLLKGEAKTALTDIKKVSINIKLEIDKQLSVIKETTKGTKEQRKEVEKLLKLHEDLLDVKKAEFNLSKISTKGMQTSGRGLGPKGLIAGGLLSAALFGMARGRAGLQQFQSEIPTRLALRGRGVRDFNLSPVQRKLAAQAGMSRGEVERQRFGAIEAFGRGGAGTNQVIQRGLFEKGAGLKTGALTEIGAQLRQQIGGAEANQVVMKLQASLIASGIDDAIGPYLSTAANMLTSINESGIANQAEVLQTLSLLSKDTKKAPEIISKHLIGIDSAIKQSSDERNAFLQVAFAKAGIGGQTIGGTQAAISGGLFGSGVLKRLDLETQKQFRAMGLGASPQKRAKAILEEMQSVNMKFGPGATGQQKLQTGRFMTKQFGAQGAIHGVEMAQLMKRIAEGDKKAEAALKKLTQSPQEQNLADIRKSTEGQWNETQQLHKTIKSELGEKLIPVSTAMNLALSRIDEGIGMMAPAVTGIANFLMNMLGVIAPLTNKQKEEKKAELQISKTSLESQVEKAGAFKSQPYMEVLRSGGYGQAEQKLKSLEEKLKDVNKLLGSAELISTKFDEVINAINETTTKNIENRNFSTRKITQKTTIAGVKPGKTIPE